MMVGLQIFIEKEEMVLDSNFWCGCPENIQGVGSKVVVTGDVTQIDLPDRTRSGLVDALQVLKGVNGIAQCYFTEKDVVRHRLVQEIIKAYEAAAHPAKH